MAVPGSSSKHKEQGSAVRFILESRRWAMQALDIRCVPTADLRGLRRTDNRCPSPDQLIGPEQD